MSDAFAVEPRRRGRPRVDEPKSTISTRIPPRHHDALIKLANRGDKSLSKLLADIVARAVGRSSTR